MIKEERRKLTAWTWTSKTAWRQRTEPTPAPPYQDASRSVQERLDDLLPRMTLEEKLGQMCQVHGRDEPDKWVLEHHAGSLLHVPLEEVQRLQEVAARETRLGIPILFGEDAIHGHCFHSGATVFPTQLAMSCSWNPAVAEEVAAITAREMVCTGMLWTFSPVLCLARDLRWGRIDETFGEDPYLIGVLAAAMVRGYQGASLSDRDSVLACAKHYAAYSAGEGGRDAYEAHVSRREMLATYLPPFETVARAGCATFMTGYQAIAGVPCTIDRWLLTDLLKDQWGLDGFVVTDWNNVGALITGQRVCADMAEATLKSLEAGNDMVMTTPAFIAAAVDLVREGTLDGQIIDAACGRILRKKFELGLFDARRYPDMERGAALIGCPEHVEAALRAAHSSIVLLKNDNDLLPLAADIGSIALVGPNADDLVAQLGDWSFGSQQAAYAADDHPREGIATVLDGLKARIASGTVLKHCPGTSVSGDDRSGIPAAVAAAQQADLVIAVVGDDLATHGEGSDRANLDLSGCQQELLERVAATGKPLVVVLINSKPLSVPWVKEHATPVLEAFSPGMRGGQAIAEIIFGDVNPSGKLTISFPYHVGQQPVHYQQMPGWHCWVNPGGYIDLPSEPLFPFGFGLSYTSYAYENLRVLTPELTAGQALRVTVDVTNTGGRAGVEIVQLYINDCVSSVTTPRKELKAFARVNLMPGETKTVELTVEYEQLGLIGAAGQSVVEPGEFDVMVGASSRDEDLLTGTTRIV